MLATERIKTLYESPDNGFGQTFIYQDVLYPDNIIIVKTARKGEKSNNILVSKEAILSVASQLNG